MGIWLQCDMEAFGSVSAVHNCRLHNVNGCSLSGTRLYQRGQARAADQHQLAACTWQCLMPPGPADCRQPSQDLCNPLVQVCNGLLKFAALSPCRRIVKLPPDVVGGVVNAVGLLPPQLDMDRVAEDRDAVLLRFQEADEVGWHVQLESLQQHCDQGPRVADNTVYLVACSLSQAVAVAAF